MNSETIVMCVVALILGMLMANMLKSVCGCNVVEGSSDSDRLQLLLDDRIKQLNACEVREILARQACPTCTALHE